LYALLSSKHLFLHCSNNFLTKTIKESTRKFMFIYLQKTKIIIIIIKEKSLPQSRPCLTTGFGFALCGFWGLHCAL
jgi:hypothetical protein